MVVQTQLCFTFIMLDGEAGNPLRWPLLPPLQGAETVFTVEGPCEEKGLLRAAQPWGGQGAPWRAPD